MVIAFAVFEFLRSLHPRRAEAEAAGHGNVVEVTDSSFDSALAGAKGLVVVDFTASWCPPCRMIAPVYSRLSLKYSNVLMMKVDVDKARDTAAKCAITSMPTFQFYRDGKRVSQFSGADVSRLEAEIVKHGGRGRG